ncbi:MAG: chromosomal replication initiator DnaA, partial [Pseudomonadota bacterium]
MMPQQLPLDLPPVTAMGRADFFEAPCNAGALASMLDHTVWPVPRMILAGPRGSGRSHLAHIFAETTGGAVITARELATSAFPDFATAIAVDDADTVAGDAAAEEALFHLHNGAAARSIPLLLTGADLPGTWGVALPDLASRLAAYPVTQLHTPDDGLLTMVLAKLFDDRQLFPDPEVLTYLV